MNYKAYPTKKTTPSRLSRKGSRRTIFTYNKKLKKLLRKQARSERAQLVSEE